MREWVVAACFDGYCFFANGQDASVFAVAAAFLSSCSFHWFLQVIHAGAENLTKFFRTLNARNGQNPRIPRGNKNKRNQ
jgi:hypothetical protein